MGETFKTDLSLQGDSQGSFSELFGGRPFLCSRVTVHLETKHTTQNRPAQTRWQDRATHVTAQMLHPTTPQQILFYKFIFSFDLFGMQNHRDLKEREREVFSSLLTLHVPASARAGAGLRPAGLEVLAESCTASPFKGLGLSFKAESSLSSTDYALERIIVLWKEYTCGY